MCNALERRGVSLLKCTNKADVANETACSGKDARAGAGAGAGATASMSASEEVEFHRTPTSSDSEHFRLWGRCSHPPNSVVPGVPRTQPMPLYHLGFSTPTQFTPPHTHKQANSWNYSRETVEGRERAAWREGWEVLQCGVTRKGKQKVHER